MWNDALKFSLKELRRMVSTKTLLNHLYWTILFTFHNNASAKKLGAVIIQNNKILPSSQKTEQPTA